MKVHKRPKVGTHEDNMHLPIVVNQQLVPHQPSPSATISMDVYVNPKRNRQVGPRALGSTIDPRYVELERVRR